MVDVSVVIVSWNAKHYLGLCLGSIRRTVGSLSAEVIVVDNGSMDGSPGFVRDHYPEVDLLESDTNLGFAKANNLGMAHSSGRYICFVNSDVIVLESCLQKLLGCMQHNREIGIAGPKVLNSDMTLQPSARRLPSLMGDLGQALFLDRIPLLNRLFAGSNMRLIELRKTRTVPGLSGCFWIVRREALNQVGGLDESFFMYGEDNDWCKRFAKAGWDVLYCRESSAIHYGGGSSANAPHRFYVEMKKADLLYLRKHSGVVCARLAWFVLLLHASLRFLGWRFIFQVLPKKREKACYMEKRYSACIRWQLRECMNRRG